MVTQTETYDLTREEFEELIENECRATLGMSLREFLLKRDNGGLPDKPLAIYDIELLLRLARKQ